MLTAILASAGSRVQRHASYANFSDEFLGATHVTPDATAPGPPRSDASSVSRSWRCKRENIRIFSVVELLPQGHASKSGSAMNRRAQPPARRIG